MCVLRELQPRGVCELCVPVRCESGVPAPCAPVSLPVPAWEDVLTSPGGAARAAPKPCVTIPWDACSSAPTGRGLAARQEEGKVAGAWIGAAPSACELCECGQRVPALGRF